MQRMIGPSLAAGAVAGLALGLFHLLVSEPTVGRAIAFEAARQASPGAAEPELVSRTVQQVGLVVGAALYGLALGLLFGVVYALVHGMLDVRDPWRRSLRLGALGYTSLALVPFLKYPANPPGVGDPATISHRSSLFLAVLALSIAATAVCWLAYRRLSRRLPSPGAQVTAASLYALLLGVIFVAMPENPDPIAAPAKLVWEFRLLSLAGLTLFWAVLAVGFGTLERRRHRLAAAPEHDGSRRPLAEFAGGGLP